MTFLSLHLIVPEGHGKVKFEKNKFLSTSLMDAIQHGFIHYQFLRLCQATRFQYLNAHILLGNRCILQQEHVDCKIADALLKKGTKQHADGWGGF